jgi:hypothetical protein
MFRAPEVLSLRGFVSKDPCLFTQLFGSIKVL